MMTDDFSYDRLPYPSKFFVQTFPDRLATQATLFGMDPPAVETCRVLELGCGNGSNLIAQAYIMPNATFVGVDLGIGHIDDAKAAAAELGLTNVEFRQMDVMEMSEADFGKFDYITAHGLFSWIPDVVRERTLGLFAELLASNGVGYMSYSAYPGAHEREIAQRAMRFASRNISEPTEKVAKALSFLKFAAENTPNRGTFQQTLANELKRHAVHAAADVFHDDLSDLNTPFYFHQFADMLGEHGLQFLAEAELHAMGTNDLSAAARNFVDSLDDAVEREQYLDLLRGRAFRQTLFVHRSADLERDLEPSIVDRFLIASSMRPAGAEPDLASAKVERFVGPKGTGIELDLPLAKTAIAKLGTVWGRALPFGELVEDSKRKLSEAGFAADDWESQIEIVRKIVLQIALASNMIELHVYQPTAETAASSMPRISRLARWQMKNAANVLTQFGLDMKIEDRVSRHLLQLLDGTRSRNAVFDELGKFIRSAHDIEGKHEILRTLPEWLDASLGDLARIGMFEA